jgi:hypothetical protein
LEFKKAFFASEFPLPSPLPEEDFSPLPLFFVLLALFFTPVFSAE